MRLIAPIIITPRLLPGVAVGNGIISIEYSNRPGDESRTRYQYHIDIDCPLCDERATEYTADDVQSGCQGGNLQNGLGSLLSFLSASAEAYDCQPVWKIKKAKRTGRKSDNDDLFPTDIMRWASENSDELSSLSYEIGEPGQAIGVLRQKTVLIHE